MLNYTDERTKMHSVNVLFFTQQQRSRGWLPWCIYTTEPDVHLMLLSRRQLRRRKRVSRSAYSSHATSSQETDYVGVSEAAGL